MVALVAAVFVGVVAVVATPLIEPLPKSVLAVVVVAASVSLLDFGAIRRLRRVREAEAWLAVAALVGVLTLGILGGLALAITLSIGVYVYRSVRPHDAVLGRIDSIDGYHDIDRADDAQTIDGLIVYRFDAALFFPNAGYFRERVLALCDVQPRPRWLLLNAEAIVYIDSTAIDMLRQLHNELVDAGTTLVIARAKGMLRDVFDSTGLRDTIGAEQFYPTVRAAVDAYRDLSPRSGA
jgi:SulP family sulfate permease